MACRSGGHALDGEPEKPSVKMILTPRTGGFFQWLNLRTVLSTSCKALDENSLILDPAVGGDLLWHATPIPFWQF